MISTANKVIKLLSEAFFCEVCEKYFPLHNGCTISYDVLLCVECGKSEEARAEIISWYYSDLEGE